MPSRGLTSSGLGGLRPAGRTPTMTVPTTETQKKMWALKTRPILNHLADIQHSFAFLTCFMQHSDGPDHNGIVTWVTDNVVMGRRVDAMIQMGDLDGAGWCHTL